MDNFDLASALACLQGASDTDTAKGAAGDSVLVHDMPAHQYHADRDALSCSMLKPLLTSPAHFQAALVTPFKSTDAMEFGTLLHLLVLEPLQLGNEVAVFPGVASKRTTEYKEFAAQRANKLIVDEPTFDEARRLSEKVLTTMYRGRPLQKFIEESIPEATVYFTDPDTGLRLRVRMDAYHPDITFDLKSTRFGDPRAFARDAVDLHYDMQGFMYSYGRCLYEGTQALRPFVFITAETAAPYSVSTLTASAAFMDNGAKKLQASLIAYKACTASGYWPDLGTDGEVDIEPWHQFNGEAGWRAALRTRATM
jgi:hypothetical protein